MLRREDGDLRPLEPHLDVARGGRRRLAHPVEHGALGRDDDARRAALQVRNRVAPERPRDADAVRPVLLDLGRGRLRERDERRLLAVLLEGDLEVADVLRRRGA